MSWTVLVAESLEERDRELCRRLESAWNPKTGQLEAQLLVPTLQRTAYLQARIVEHFEGRCWLPRVETLEQFLRRQSQSLEEPAPWISDEMRILMIQALLPETEYGKRRSPGRGTARRFLEVIEALSGVWREDRDLDPLAQKLLGDPHAYGHTVVELARRYERRLRERNVRDWRLVALDLIEAWRRQAGSPLGRTLVVDSFSRLRPIEADLLDALAARFLEVIVTLSGSDSDLDKELNRRGLLVQRSVWSWAKRHRPRVVFCRPSEDDGSRSAGLRQVARRLFEPVAALLEAPPLALPPGGLRLLRPATRREEVRRVAREIRDSARSLPALDLQGIALVVPSVQAYRELIQEVFQEYGVPVVFFQGVPLASHPEVRRALKLLRLLAREEGRWTAETIADLIREARLEDAPDWEEQLSRWLPDGAPSSWALWPFSLDRFLRTARRVGLTGDFDLERWAERIRAVLSVQSDEEDEGEPAVESLEGARRRVAQAIRDLLAVDRFVQEAKTLGEAEDIPRFFATLRQFCRRYQLVALGQESDVQDRRAREAFWRFLNRREADYHTLAELMPGTVEGSVGLRCAEMLLRALEDPGTTYLPAQTPEGVRVISFPQVAGLRFQRVYLLGLTETDLPSKGGTNFLLAPERDPEAAELFVTLESLPMERFLFREVIANAQQVVLSCPRLERGRMLVPSPFLEDLRTALRAELPEEPPSADSKAYLSTREVLLEMGRRLNAEGAERLCPFLSAEGGQEALPENVATLIAMERLRSSREQWSRFDGYLDPLPVEVAEYLRRHADRPQAPSQLRLYVLCSIRYLFRELLGLRRMRPSEPEVPPTLRGTLVHTILERYFREGPPADDLERERRRLAQIAEEVLAPYDAVFDSLYWQVEKERLTAGLTGSGAEEKGVLAQFLELEREFEAFFSGSGWQRGARVEVRFEEGSEILPLAVEGPAGTVRIAGRIDRVDLNPEAGQALIVDYKVGSRAPRVQDVLEGIELQLPLYLAMIPRLFESVEPVEPVGGVYYHLHPFGEVQVGSGLLLQEAAGPKLRGRRFLVESQEAFREALSRAQQAVLRIREHLSAGRFPWTQFEPSQAGCPFCDFATICRLDDSRREEMRSFQPVFEPIPLLPTAEVTGPEEAE